MTFPYLTGSNGLEWTTGSACEWLCLRWLCACDGSARDGSACEEPGSPDRPDDPGGQVLVAQAGLAEPGEHLDVPGLRVADVYHDGSRGRRQVTVGRCRRR